MQLIPALAVERRRIVLLAPGSGFVPEVFRKVQVHKTLHQSLVAGAQRLRGHVYLSDGAIEQRDLSQDGRHVQDADDKSWFVLTVRGAAEVVGCARYRPHAPHVQFDELSVSRSALARSPLWGQRLRAAVQADITDAHHRRLSYVEVGGWALASDVRCTTEALRIALSMYTLARLLNGALGITTVTTRHHSCSILRRLGGRSLLDDGVELPSYFDPVYKCEMEILRFDSASPNPRFESWLDNFRGSLMNVPVICGGAAREWCAIPSGFAHAGRLPNLRHERHPAPAPNNAALVHAG